MAKIIDGKQIAEKIKDKITREIFNFHGLRPNLAIIMVGEEEDSQIYVSSMEKEARKVGIDTHLYKCDQDTLEKEIFSTIECLNNDDLIDGIIIQLPLPDGFDVDGIIRAINKEKDIDRFHPDNLSKILKVCNPNLILPPVFGAILEILIDINYNVEKKQVCILSNSEIFGRSLAKVLTCRQAICRVCKAEDPSLRKKTRQADILISILGRPKFITKEMVKDQAIVVDVGISREIGAITGDVDLKDIKKVAGYVTPVPGGIGPITTACVFRNTLILFKKNKKLRS